MAQHEINAENPWPWLDPYSEGKATEFFNGRDQESEQLLQLVQSNPASVLFGKSGLGKTSLLQAGLFPKLRVQGLLPVLIRVNHEPNAPPLAAQVGQRLQEEIDANGLSQISKLNVAPEPGAAQDRLWLDLHSYPLSLTGKDGLPIYPVFVFDQFEEIFTQGAIDPSRQRASFGVLGDLIENRIPQAIEYAIRDNENLLDKLDLGAQPYRIVLSLREDFLPDLERWCSLIPRLGPHRFRLLALTETQAIDATLRTGGSLVNEGSARQIVQYVANQQSNLQGFTGSIQSTQRQVEPALLSLLCSGLNKQRQEQGSEKSLQLDASNLDESGQEIIENFYDAALKDLSRGSIEWVENELITPDGVRLMYPLQSVLGRKGFLPHEIEQLIVRRLVRKELFAEGGDRVELVHDRLAAVALQRRQRRQQTDEQKKLERDFELKKSEATAMAEVNLKLLAGRRRQIFATTIASVFAILAIALALVSWNQKSGATLKAREATLLQVAAESSSASNSDLEGGSFRSMLTALGAYRALSASNARAMSAAFLVLQIELTQSQKLLKTIPASADVVAFSPDGKRIISGSSEHSLQLWDAVSGNTIGKPFEGHTNSVTSVAFSPDGKHIISGSSDHTLRLWDAVSVTPIGKRFEGPTYGVSSVAFSPDGKRIISGSSEHTLHLWDAVSGTPIGKPFEGHAKGVTSVAFSPDGKYIISGSGDDTLRLWDAVSGTQIGKPFEGHTDTVTSVAFSPDGKRIISSSDDTTLRLWDVVYSTQIGKPFEGHTDEVTSVAFSPDGMRIVSGGRDKTLRLWDAISGTLIGKPFEGYRKAVTSVAFSPDGMRIISGSRDNTLRVWSAVSGTPIGNPFKGHTDGVTSAAFSPVGMQIISGSQDKTLRLWNAVSGTAIGKPFDGHTYWVTSVAFSPDGQRIISGSRDKTLRLWDAASGAPIGEPFEAHRYGVTSVAFSPDGKRIISGSVDNTLRLWDAVSFTQIGEPLEGHTDVVTSAAFSPDGKRIISGSDDNTLRLWDAVSGSSIGKQFKGHTAGVSSIAFSPDGKRIISGSYDTTLRLWDAVSGSPIGKQFKGHAAGVTSIAFSPDGKRIISGSYDKTLRLWDAVSGTQIGKPFEGHTDTVTSVAFSPDGQRIISSNTKDFSSTKPDNLKQMQSETQFLRIWPMPDGWADLLCEKLTRNMTQDEWNQWVSPDINYVVQCPKLPGPIK